MADLLRRVRSATGPSRTLDADIGCAVDPAEFYQDSEPHYYTESLDVALALVQRALPGAYSGVQENLGQPGDDIDRSWNGYVYVASREFEGTQAKTPALALVAALLAALDERATDVSPQ